MLYVLYHIHSNRTYYGMRIYDAILDNENAPRSSNDIRRVKARILDEANSRVALDDDDPLSVVLRCWMEIDGPRANADF